MNYYAKYNQPLIPSRRASTNPPAAAFFWRYVGDAAGAKAWNQANGRRPIYWRGRNGKRGVLIWQTLPGLDSCVVETAVRGRHKEKGLKGNSGRERSEGTGVSPRFLVYMSFCGDGGNGRLPITLA